MIKTISPDQISKEYDAIIVGAGMGGIVCACYLAKAGMKVLLIEKNKSAGGYCTSFMRGGYRFDACVHALSSYRKGGRLYRVLDDLSLTDRFRYNRHNPTDVLYSPSGKINFFSNIQETINEFSRMFPNEKSSIRNFFNYVSSHSVQDYLILRKKTFSEMLDDYFCDEKLKMIISILIFGLVGSFPTRLSALVATMIYREFVFDGGVYPKDGIQGFVDMLIERFSELGGHYINLKVVKNVQIENNKALGVAIEKPEIFIKARYTILNGDPHYTCPELFSSSKRGISGKFYRSFSMFVNYLGLREDFPYQDQLKANVWVLKSFDWDKVVVKSPFDQCDFFVITSPSSKSSLEFDQIKKTACITGLCEYRNADFWQKSVRDQLSKYFIGEADRIFPNFSSYINYNCNATPATLYKWTLNSHGAAYGWESTREQFASEELSIKTPISNLFLSSHWSNLSSGVTSVSNVGYDVAQLIIRREKRQLAKHQLK